MEDRRVKTTFLAVSVLYVWFRRCNADINTLDIEKERTFPTPYATSPYLHDLLESAAEQKISPDTSNFFLNEYDYIIGPVASTEGCIALAFLKSDQSLIGKPDFELYTLNISPADLSEKYHFGLTDQIYDQVYKRYANKTTYNCVAQVTNPKSRGTVRLQSANPYDAPLIDPNYFENYDDMLKTIPGMKKCLAIANSDAVQTLGAKAFDTVFPGCESYVGDLNATLECQARSVVLTLSHEVGTCKMGSPDDPTTVLDSRLRVKDINGLRVVDGSVMPAVVSGNTNAAIVMIAEKAADMIKADNFKFHFHKYI